MCMKPYNKEQPFYTNYKRNVYTVGNNSTVTRMETSEKHLVPLFFVTLSWRQKEWLNSSYTILLSQDFIRRVFKTIKYNTPSPNIIHQYFTPDEMVNDSPYTKHNPILIFIRMVDQKIPVKNPHLHRVTQWHTSKIFPQNSIDLDYGTGTVHVSSPDPLIWRNLCLRDFYPPFSPSRIPRLTMTPICQWVTPTTSSLGCDTSTWPKKVQNREGL